MLRVLWIMMLWIFVWKILELAVMMDSKFLLLADFIFSYFLCVRWYPVFPYEQKDTEDQSDR